MASVFVTGASGGLGLAAATALAGQGHDVVVHARTRESAPPPPPGTAWRGVVIGDLSDLDQTREVAEQADEAGRFDAVIHNAGALRPPEAVPVNTIAPYVLTALMEKPGRLVYLTSAMHRGGSRNLGGLTGRGTYSDSKLWVTTLAMAFADAWQSTTAHAVDPGWVPTRMGGRFAPDDLTAGHQTQVWLAVDPDVTPRTGGYWHHRHTQRPAAAAIDPGFQRALLEALANRTGIRLED